MIWLGIMGIAAVLLALWLVILAIEARVGTKLFASARTTLDARAEALYHNMVMGGLPHVWRDVFVQATHTVTHALVRAGVLALRMLERPLSRLSYKMRVQQPKATAQEVSEFLKTITPERTIDPSTIQEKSV